MKSRSLRFVFTVVVLLAAGFGPARAALRLPRIFSDHMVLQFGQHVPVWGWAEPGSEVTVTFRAFLAKAVADSDGRWRVEIGPLSPGGPDRLVVTSGGEIIALEDVLAGEVWLCSGQSNMEMTVDRVFAADSEIAASDFPTIRQFKVAHVTSNAPLDELDSLAGRDYMQVWQPASPETVARFTAAGYFFARDIQAHLGDVPVGLVNSSWGGSVAEAWVTGSALRGNPATADIPDKWLDYLREQERWLNAYKEFQENAQKAVAEGKPEPVYYKVPSCIYNAMIAPLAGYGIRGVLWYQGEANVFRAAQYAPLFKALIEDWRVQWDRELPFIWVQLPNFGTEVPNWPPLREAQAAALSLPGTAMAVTIDVGEQDDIHPRDKQTVGRRLALAARGLVYLEDIPYRAPLLESTSITDGRVTVTFANTADSLTTVDSQAPRGFAVAGADKVFHAASAEANGGKVTLWSEKVPNPVAVRYGWQNWPPALNLYSSYLGKNWLPATPFRTDSWDDVPAVAPAE